MKYYRYFELFLNIEDRLCDYIQQLEYTEKSKNIFTPKISLLILQACPLIESYMVQLCISSNTVIKHPLYSWNYNWKLWEAKDKKVKEKDGKRSIGSFPKFSYITEKVFLLSGKKCTFFFSDKFQQLNGKDHYTDFSPYKPLSSFSEYTDYIPKDGAQFPTGLDTPKWWTAYNKIKHDMDEAENRVTYAVAIEALAALFILLTTADVEIDTLDNNGYVSKGEIRSKLFSYKIT